ncbi:MAG: hypothetical protein KGS10_04420 [Chloroflexi bacterium]|nr:hypothetical protein [Chloroflexota bacterium]
MKVDYRIGTRDGVATVQVDELRRRVVVGLPLPASFFDPQGWLMALTFRVCGPDAVADGLVGAHLGALAFCAKGGTAQWRKDWKIAARDEDSTVEGEE